MNGDDENVVDELSIHALRVELQRRGITIVGMKTELQNRLKCAILESGKNISVPTRFKRSPPYDLNSMPAKRPRTHSDHTELSTENNCANIKPIGYWMGRSVWVMNPEHMNILWTISDAYGKGNLSRSAPTYSSSIDTTLTKGKAARQLIALEKQESKSTGLQSSRDGIEHLQLTLVEAYYATFHAKKMELFTRIGEPLDDASRVWEIFSKQLPQFAERFAAYSHYRATGWMPRSGLKYGVDWVLYPLGFEKHSHAPYCVIVSCSAYQKTIRVETTWIRLQNKLRLVKNVAKTLIVAQVGFDEGFEPSGWEDAIRNLRISEITVDRWVA